jgi:hypothetical protein
LINLAQKIIGKLKNLIHIYLVFYPSQLVVDESTKKFKTKTALSFENIKTFKN